MQGMQTVSIFSGQNGDGVVYTTEIDFGPGFLVVAQSSLNNVDDDDGGGVTSTGIAGYRARSTPSGPDTPVSFGTWTTWQPYLYVQNMTAVIFGTAVGGSQSCNTICNIFYW